MLDRDLIRKINTGRCFALVGSGPSCEVGYPSWYKLAQLTLGELTKTGRVSDLVSYEKYLAQGKYPELFRLAEEDLGGRTSLVSLLKRLLVRKTTSQGVLYDTISRWPFACYITTNYDDEIKRALERLGENYEVVRNRPEDFHPFRDGASHLLQKLHSDLDHPNELILTSVDYQQMYSGDTGKYFRDKLRQTFEMFDLLIVGHSLRDPDIQYILRLAKNTASPAHPIYIIAADCTKAEEQEFFEKYNIVVIPYSNRDNAHAELRHLLKIADRYYITPRKGRREGPEVPARPKDEVENAMSLFIYRRLQSIGATDYLSPLILSGLLAAGDRGVPKEKITDMGAIRALGRGGANIQESASNAAKQLVEAGLASDTSGGFRITPAGREQAEQHQKIREIEKDQAYGQFRLSLQRIYSSISGAQLDQCAKLAEEVIVLAFAQRGLAIARQVFSGQQSSSSELLDVFGFVVERATAISAPEVRAAFVEVMHQFLVDPSLPQRKYLASVSQGYFMYHLLGLDPSCCRVRRDVFHNTLWLCDSSVVLPLIAKGCHNHEYAVALFRALANANGVFHTTHRLLHEAWEHLDWACRFVKERSLNSIEFLRAALVKGSYKQNLFLDGFIRLGADRQVGTFSDYLELILPSGKTTRTAFEQSVADAGVRLIDIPSLDGFDPMDWAEMEEAKPRIQSEREKRGIFRSERQVEAEAEVWSLINNVRSGKYSIDGIQSAKGIYFVSQSRILDLTFRPAAVAAWTPEALYRYLLTLPGSDSNVDILQQCMLHEYYYAGISFIDKQRYMDFFGPTIDTAKASFQRERANYLSDLESRYTEDIDEAFERTPDLEKPFFIAQMGWRRAELSQEREEAATRRAQEAEARAEKAQATIRKLEQERGMAWRARDKRSKEQEAARLRNLQDPAHVRKRLRQAKKRAKKKK